MDVVAGIPDSGTGHAMGYAQEKGVPFRRPFVKYTPTWPRSFMPQEQRVRDLVARMKLIPVRELIDLITTQRYMHLSPAALGTAVQLLDSRRERGDILETAKGESVKLLR